MFVKNLVRYSITIFAYAKANIYKHTNDITLIKALTPQEDALIGYLSFHTKYKISPTSGNKKQINE